jgi:hypothetical protein
MKRWIVAAAAVCAFAAGPEKYTGVITDTMCKADHKDMNMGPDAKCTVECVKSMGGKYALWDGTTAWELSDQKTPQKFAGKKVTVTGTADAAAKTLKVQSISAAK